MSTISTPVPRVIAKATYFVDVVLCQWVHNPFVTTSAVLLTTGFLLAKLAYLAVSNDTVYPVYVPDFLLDFVQNAISLVFIFRFTSNGKSTLNIVSNKVVECILFVALNCCALSILFWPTLSSVYADMNPFFRVFLWGSVLCPYLVIALNAFECVSQVWKRRNPEAGLSEKSQSTPSEMLLSLLVDANNSFLAIFMAQSFTLINMHLPLIEQSWVTQLYKYACYSLKFHLIYCFVLYEVIVVIYEATDIKKYSSIYTPVSLGPTKEPRFGGFFTKSQPFLLTAVIALMLYDIVVLVLSKI